MVCKRVVVSGRVQGVFFRDSCRREAVARGVRGWVRNRSDGRVEALFEGEPAAVDHMVAWTSAGPPRAVVSSIEITSEHPAQLTGFRIIA